MENENLGQSAESNVKEEALYKIDTKNKEIKELLLNAKIESKEKYSDLIEELIVLGETYIGIGNVKQLGLKTEQLTAFANVYDIAVDMINTDSASKEEELKKAISTFTNIVKEYYNFMIKSENNKVRVRFLSKSDQNLIYYKNALQRLYFFGEQILHLEDIDLRDYNEILQLYKTQNLIHALNDTDSLARYSLLLDQLVEQSENKYKAFYNISVLGDKIEQRKHELQERLTKISIDSEFSNLSFIQNKKAFLEKGMEQEYNILSTYFYEISNMANNIYSIIGEITDVEKLAIIEENVDLLKQLFNLIEQGLTIRNMVIMGQQLEKIDACKTRMETNIREINGMNM